MRKLVPLLLLAPVLSAHATSEALLHSFGAGARDGIFPEADLAYIKGKLFGPTSEGGGTKCQFNLGCGTIFESTLAGTEKVIYVFRRSAQRGLPAPNGVIEVTGDLYGTTSGGGGHNAGTVFKLTPAGVESRLHDFGRRSDDGAAPFGLLTYAHGTLFGTTLRGGIYNRGTIFALTLDGAEIVLHSFGGPGDGADPFTGLTAANGVLYGTTGGGGHKNDGTVFSITPNGVEKILYSFQGGADGNFPQGRLLRTEDGLLGTTYEGGSRKCGGSGCGTSFKVTFSGVESILHTFVAGPDDGYLPLTGLVAIGGSYYGTTQVGGQHGSCEGSGTSCGTVYQLTKAGIFTLIHRFPDGPSDGQYPVGNLVAVGTTLYGLTQGGGTYGYGSLFSITP